MMSFGQRRLTHGILRSFGTNIYHTKTGRDYCMELVVGFGTNLGTNSLGGGYTSASRSVCGVNGGTRKF